MSPLPAELERAAAGIFLDGLRRPLLVAHMASSVLLLGASTHHAFHLRSWWKGAPRGRALERRWARVSALSYASSFLLGAVLYPSYRFRVRGLYLDGWAPWASRLFDLKEIDAALTLLLALGLGFVAPPIPKEDVSSSRARAELALLRAYIGLSAFVCVQVWFQAIAGVLVTSVRGLG